MRYLLGYVFTGKLAGNDCEIPLSVFSLTARVQTQCECEQQDDSDLGGGAPQHVRERRDEADRRGVPATRAQDPGVPHHVRQLQVQQAVESQHRHRQETHPQGVHQIHGQCCGCLIDGRIRHLLNTFSNLLSLQKSKCTRIAHYIPKDPRIFYTDEEEDDIFVGSDDEYKEMVKVAINKNKVRII